MRKERCVGSVPPHYEDGEHGLFDLTAVFAEHVRLFQVKD